MRLSSSAKLRGYRILDKMVFRGLSTRLTPADAQLPRPQERFTSTEKQHENALNDLVYCISMAPDSTDFHKNFENIFSKPTAIMKEQLSNTVRTFVDNRPLPTTLDDALRPTRRAIVITEVKAPFKIFNVNEAWEELCGYKYVECRGKTLGAMVKGPDTDTRASTGLISQLLQGNEAGATITNYTKEGRRFRNRVRVGTLKNADGEVTHFVGVLQEVKDGM